MTYDFSRLDQRRFEEMIQSLATARFNSFTDGVFTPRFLQRDGQRDILIETPNGKELSKNVPLYGRTIINCKCKEQGSHNNNLWSFLNRELAKELADYSKKEPDYLPKTLVFCVNIPLTAVKDVGLYDRAQALIQEKRKEFEERLKPISNIHILGANEISNMLALYPGVARRFGFFNGPIVLRNISDADNYITPSTVSTNNKHTVSDLLHHTVIGTRAAFVVGAHGFGKTTYMLELLKTERDNRDSKFNYIVWANYENDIKKSIMASLSEYNKDAAQTIKFDDINNEESLVFIDGANASIVGELNSSKYNFYSIVSLCSSKDATIRLGWDIHLAEKIFCEELKDYNPIADTKLLTSIIGMTNGHPMVASLLGKQAYKHLISNETLTDFHNLLKEEGFGLSSNSIECVATQIASRFKDDYENLDNFKKNILKCFCLLDEHRISPKKIGWHADNLKLFDELRKDGFLECDVSGTYQEYYMHAILRAAVQQLCGKINYDDIRDFVKAIGEYIDRDNLDGADIMYFYHEVMAAFALFSKMSGSEFYNKPQIESFECQPEYAWMACNIFSAFDDYKNDLAYVGSKYAAKLCELSHEKHAFSAYRLAISYNAVGYLPSAYNGNEYDILKQMQLITENFDYLNKAKEIVDQLNEAGENHYVLDAKLNSNTGAVWQRLIRLLTLADFEPKTYKKIIANIRSKARESFDRAAVIRADLSNEYTSDDKKKREYKRDIARSKYQIATCYFYEKDYDTAIKKHNEAINGFEELHSDTFKLSDLLFTSYSRLADTEYRKAQKDCSYKDLNYAIGHFSKAYEYLGELEESRQNKERSYYESFLKACIDMRNQNANYPFKLNKKSETINGEAETINGEAVIEKLRNRIHQALDLSGMSSSEVNAEKAKLRGYIGKAKGYYKNTDEE